MNYFNSTEAVQLFHCPKEDNVIDDCLSHKIDIFNEILNHKQKCHWWSTKQKKNYQEGNDGQHCIVRQ